VLGESAILSAIMFGEVAMLSGLLSGHRIFEIAISSDIVFGEAVILSSIEWHRVW